MAHADVIVLGLGGMGTAAAWHLARRGARVLGLEQFALGHALGSSHGHTRIIRQAYYEHPSYVPLVRRAYQGWYDLEQTLGTHLLTACPCLTIGASDGELVTGVQRSAAEHSLSIETLAGDEIPTRFPAFRPLGPGEVGIVEHTAGFLYVDDCVRAMADAARSLGAVLHDNERVVSWHAEGDGVRVVCEKETHTASSLVITAGPWAGPLLGSMGAKLSVMRQVVLWLAPDDPALYRRDTFPIFVADGDDGVFYGIPMLDARGVKVARHYGAAELPSVGDVEREITPADEEPVRAFLRRRIPGADGERRDASTCVYTLTPDRHFVIDHHPDSQRVIVAAGFSGHGFKFAPVVGEMLAGLALDGKTTWPVELFGRGRLIAE